jgi:release factor glutamine methyltransferase
MAPDWLVLDLLRTSTEFLSAQGIEGARLDAEVLLARVLDVPRIDLYARHDRVLSSGEVDAYREAVRRRVAREPVAYIVGEREFRSLAFTVTPDVLIPRPETEHLVEAALDRLEDVASPVVADVGTGSGCIAVSLAAARSDLTVHAVDRSAAALSIARENAARHEVEERVTLHEGDLLEPLLDVAFHLVLSNPPYVSEEEWGGLMPEVRDHEPKGALVPGPDALAAYRTILEGAPDLLVPGGAVILELPGEQTDAVRELASGYASVEVVKDYAGHDRVLIACPARPGSKPVG